jgi:hypothetical protein
MKQDDGIAASRQSQTGWLILCQTSRDECRNSLPQIN